MSAPDLEQVRMDAACALTRAVDPDAKKHLRRIVSELNAEPLGELVECLDCGRVGAPERIRETDCPHSSFAGP